MKLLTKAIVNKFDKVGSQEEIKDPVVIAKFFTPWSNWTWFATEYDPERKIFFGMVHGHEKEWGYFSLDELVEVKGPFGLGIERDMMFDPERGYDGAKISEVAA
jgi:hypothetical protein|tara:strand:- start:281 stop:592 length:312 start_codon:yes stop_codon:yes gene_type:complete